MADDFLRSLGERFDPNRELGKEDPVAWLQHRLGEHAWSKQREIMWSVQNNQRTAVPSAHGTGKSHITSRIIARFIDTHEEGTAFVITTAPRAHQVRAILWRYLRRAHKKAGLAGTITQGMVPEWKIDGELVGFGRKPADLDADTFQGLHEYRLLIAFDEACGINESLYNAAESLMTNDGCHWLCIGNPDISSSFFKKVCTTEPGWNVIPISAYDCPAYTGEEVPQDVADRLVSRKWVEDKLTRWGPDSALFRAKVLGEWVDAEDGLVPLAWVKLANARWHEWMERDDRTTHQPPGRRIIGVDPAHLGSDATAIVVRQGPVVLSVKLYRKLDTIAVANLVKDEIRAGGTGATAVVDTVGIGAGITDQLRAGGYSHIAFNGASGTKRRDRTGTWRYPNARSAAWHNLREILDPVHGGKLCLPDHDDLTNDVTTPTFAPVAGGLLKVEEKSGQRKRLGHSPDAGDALVLCLWIDPPGQRLSTADPIDPRNDTPRAVSYATASQTLADWQPRGYGPPPGLPRVYGRTT